MTLENLPIAIDILTHVVAFMAGVIALFVYISFNRPTQSTVPRDGNGEIIWPRVGNQIPPVRNPIPPPPRNNMPVATAPPMPMKPQRSYCLQHGNGKCKCPPFIPERPTTEPQKPRHYKGPLQDNISDHTKRQLRQDVSKRLSQLNAVYNTLSKQERDYLVIGGWLLARIRSLSDELNELQQ